LTFVGVDGVGLDAIGQGRQVFAAEVVLDGGAHELGFGDHRLVGSVGLVRVVVVILVASKRDRGSDQLSERGAAGHQHERVVAGGFGEVRQPEEQNLGAIGDGDERL
jgi:hypothetical protein